MTSAQPTPGATRADPAPSDPARASTGELIAQSSDQVSRLVRNEVRLAQAEVTQRASRFGIRAVKTAVSG
jgi:Putative Actinobacterial Holin-X, holin superfamily III